MAGRSITEHGREIEGAFMLESNLKVNGADGSTNYDAQHFDIPSPNATFAAPHCCFRNIYESTASSKPRGVNDRVE